MATQYQTRTVYQPPPPVLQTPNKGAYTTVTQQPRPAVQPTASPNPYQPAPQPSAQPTRPSMTPAPKPAAYRPQVQQQVRSPLATTFVPRSSILQARKNNPSGSKNKKNQKPNLFNFGGATLTGDDLRKNPNLAAEYLGLSTTPNPANLPPALINPGNVKIDGNLNSNVPLADLIHQGGAGLQAAKDQASVISGQAGLPPAISTYSPFDSMVNGDFEVIKGELVPRNQIKPAVITKDGQEIQLPDNYVQHGNNIYVFQNGNWEQVQNVGDINYDTFGYSQNKGKPARYDFAGNPLGQDGQVYTTPGNNPLDPVQDSSYAPPGGAPYTMDYFMGDNGNVDLGSLIHTGDLALNPIQQAMSAIQQLGVDPQTLLSNPAMLNIILHNAGIV